MKKKAWKQKKGRAASEEELDEAFGLIADLAEAFCKAHRNDDDSELCRDVIDTLLDIGVPLDLEALMADTDMTPPEAQEETHRRGLIHRTPTDRDKPSSKSDGGTGAKILPFPSGRSKAQDSKSADESKSGAPGLSDGLK